MSQIVFRRPPGIFSLARKSLSLGHLALRNGCPQHRSFRSTALRFARDQKSELQFGVTGMKAKPGMRNAANPLGSDGNYDL